MSAISLAALAVLLSPPAQAQVVVTRIPLVSNAIVYDPHSDRLFASIPGSQANGNSVAVIDPATGTILSYVPVGPEPGALAVSDDGRFLYVGLDGAGAVRQVDLHTLQAGLQFSLGLDPTWQRPLVAGDLAVQPGRNDVVAVARDVPNSTATGGVAIFEAGVQRTMTTPTAEEVNVIAFGATGSVLYGFNNGSTEYGVRTMTVDADGARITGLLRYGLWGTAADIQYIDRHLYSSTGLVLDLATGVLSGRFSGVSDLPSISLFGSMPFALDGARSVAYFLNWASRPTTTPRLTAYDTRTHLPIFTHDITGLPFPAKRRYRGAACGEGRVAFRLDDLIVSVAGIGTAHALRVGRSGTGSGTVSALAAGIDCGASCTAQLPVGTSVVLSATPSNGSNFDGWTGDDDCADGVVTLDGNRSCTANFSSPQAAISVRRIPLKLSDIAWNGGTERLIAAVTGFEPGLGNAVLAIDPVSGELGAPVPVAAGLGELALADDDRTLYLGQTLAPRVFRLDLDTRDLEAYDLGFDSLFGYPLYAHDLAVQPGQAEVIAVDTGRVGLTGSGGLRILDRGMPRPSAADVSAESLLAFGATADVLYAFNHATTEYGLRKVIVESGGARVESVTNVIFGAAELHYSAGLLYTETGVVVDPEAGLRVAPFPAPGDTMALDVEANRAYFVRPIPFTNGQTVRAYDLTTRQFLWAVDIPTEVDPNIGRPRASRLTRWGVNGLAFITSSALYVIDLGTVDDSRYLGLGRAGRGAGAMHASTGLSCERACSALLPPGTTVTLTATPAAGSIFLRWEGDPDCVDGTVTLNEGRECTARFLRLAAPADVDADGGSELVAWQPETGYWRVVPSGFGDYHESGVLAQWGSAAWQDVPVAGDYDGDGRMDAAVWRPGEGRWYVLPAGYYGYFERSDAWSVQWGAGSVGDIPVPGDYDGDARTDLAVWRPGPGIWYILHSSRGYDRAQHVAVQWGAGIVGDIPVPGDYDGDAKTDLAVWRPGTGTWYILFSTRGYAVSEHLAVQWGAASVGDVPVPGDYDGDGRTDIAVWRPVNGIWYILGSRQGYERSAYRAIQWGAPGDKPLALDCDGDRRMDLVIWRPGTRTWWILPSTSDFDWSGYRSVRGYGPGGTEVPIGERR